MGAAQSRQDDDDFYIESGVRVTQGLLEQLDGKPRAPRGPPSGSGGGGVAQALRPGSEQAGAAPLSDAALLRAAAASEDRALSRALQGSRRLGGLLLKAEQEELSRVETLADELIASEYTAPARPRPCAEQAADCVRCYAEHGGADPLACAPAVAAYSACAKAAWQEAVARNAL